MFILLLIEICVVITLISECYTDTYAYVFYSVNILR